MRKVMKRLIPAAAVLALSACERPRPAPPPPHVLPLPEAAPPGSAQAKTCAEPRAYARQAAINASSLHGMPWEPYRRPEFGWDTYAPIIAREIDTTCQPDTPGFAAALARWQRTRGMAADGLVSGQTFQVIKGLWQERRAFVMATLKGDCPAAPAAHTLAWVTLDEGYGQKPIQLRPGALEAYRRMVQAARREVPQIAADPQALTIFSGFRDPAADAARCSVDGNCNGVVRANCSAHRTGLAMDLNVGAAPGYKVDNSADENRRFMSRTPAYRWLAANAHRFGFVNYVFEPWHWEWTGEPVNPPVPAPPAPLPGPPSPAPVAAPGNGTAL